MNKNPQKRQIGTVVRKDKGKILSYTVTPGKVRNLVDEK